MYHPTKLAKLSKAQISKLLNGHRVRVKHGSHHTVHLSNEQHKKLMKAHSKGASCCMEFDPYQMQHHQHLREECEGDGVRGRRAGGRRGGSFMDFAKGAFKTIAPLAIDEGGKFLKSKIEGMGASKRRTHHVKHHSKKHGGDIGSDILHGLQVAEPYIEKYGPMVAPLLLGLGEGEGIRQRGRKHGSSLIPAGY